MRRWTDYFVKDFGGWPRPWKFAWVINFQKTATYPILALLIAWYHKTTAAGWIYIAMPRYPDWEEYERQTWWSLSPSQ